MGKRLLNMDSAPSRPLFNASLMCVDYLNIGAQLDILNSGCDMLHADVMDGHFCPNLTFGTDFVRKIRAHTQLPIDVHLMVEHPLDYLEAMAEAGADYLSLHSETINAAAFRTIRRIRDTGCGVGIVLNPATPISAVEAYLAHVDLLTIMTVDCGFAGQAFIPEMLEKISAAAALREKNNYHYIIQCDGCVGPSTYNALYHAGARSFVMGTSGLFRKNVPLQEACEMMKREFAEAVGVHT